MTGDANRTLKVGFVVGTFPVVSETFIIDQVADLIDRGIDVQVFAFDGPTRNFISSKHATYRMSDRTHYLRAPEARVRRLLAALPMAFGLLRKQPRAFFQAFNVLKYGRLASSLQLLYWLTPFVNNRCDVIHCHFGDMAVRFLTIKDALRLDVPIATSFYGYDVSLVFEQHQADFYDRLKRECALFFVMSNNMKQRILARGFPAEKVRVHPVSIRVSEYPFSERHRSPDQPVEIVAVGRFVEKKGFDDLLRALAIVKRRTHQAFRCSIIGAGPLGAQLRDMSASLGLQDQVDFKGYMKIEDVVALLPEMHLMVQPSKTASNGDME